MYLHKAKVFNSIEYQLFKNVKKYEKINKANAILTH